MEQQLPQPGTRVEFRGPGGRQQGVILQVLRSGDHLHLVIEFDNDGELATVRIKPAQIEAVVPA